MKRLVILCDGTWNRADSRHPTNVVRLAQMMRHFDDHGVPQMVFYLQGVGTGRGGGKITQALDRVLGGMFGLGLLENILEAYRCLILNYEPGDQIFLFGFSRGAYTARSLAGMIRKAGILSRENLARVPEALALYKMAGPQNTPDKPHIQQMRARLSPDIATSPKDAEMRGDNTPVLQITYLGVWDTVGALGVPSALPLLARPLNRKYDFHDHQLSSSVAAARHAVSIDETRRTFPPTLWDNLDRLNDRFPPDRPGNPPRYQELWFAGDHSGVGGGSGLGTARVAMDFVLRGAVEAGLAVDPQALAYDPLSARQDICAPVTNLSGLRWDQRLLRRWKSYRTLPHGDRDVADSVALRLRLMGRNYTPPTLMPWREELLKRVLPGDLLPPSQDSAPSAEMREAPPR